MQRSYLSLHDKGKIQDIDKIKTQYNNRKYEAGAMKVEMNHKDDILPLVINLYLHIVPANTGNF